MRKNSVYIVIVLNETEIEQIIGIYYYKKDAIKIARQYEGAQIFSENIQYES